MRSGSTTARGYGYKHRLERARWVKQIAFAGGYCARCHLPIAPGEPFHLDHDSYDRSRYLGVSHVKCNVSEPAKRRKRKPTAARFTNSRW
jgi:hypothetical protein